MIRVNRDQINIILHLINVNQTKQNNDSLRSAVDKAVRRCYPHHSVFVAYQSSCNCGDIIVCDDDFHKNIESIIQRTKKQSYQQ